MDNQNKTTLTPLLTPEKTSEITGATIGTLEVWRCTGRYDLPYVKIGSKVMYRPEDVTAFIKRRTVSHSE